jgi:hypothetical protein
MQQGSYGDWEPAVRRSGAHDLACPVENIAAKRLTREMFVAEGCRQRATYVIHFEAQGQVVILVGRVPLDS